MARPRVFLSAVSSEFRSFRVQLRHDLQVMGWDVLLQEELDLTTGPTLLAVIDAHIQTCRTVICLIGTRSGGGYPEAAEADAAAIPLPAGMSRASYTQYEYFLARKYGLTPLVGWASPDHRPETQDADPREPDDGALQATFAAHVQATGISRIPVTAKLDGRAEILRQMKLPAAPVPTVVPTAPAVSPPAPTKPIALPYPSLGTLFKGRDDFLVRLRNSLTGTDGKPTAITSNFAIHGLGGIGKTRAAVEYAWAHHDDYTALLAVVAESPQALQTNLGQLTGALGLTGYDAADDDVKLNAVLDWLNRHPGWLLILDNVDTPEALAAATALTARLTHGHVLLTCRLTNLPAGFTSLELDVLPLDAAADFLLERTENYRRTAPDDAAQARALAGELGQLALALEHAGAYIRRVRCTFADYRARLATSFRAAVDWSDPATTHYPRAIAASWALSVQRLSPAGKSLLERLAFLAPDPVPEFLLDVPVPNVPEQDMREALADLTAYSLVTRDPVLPRFSVHRLVLDVTRRGLDPDAARIVLEQALGWVDAAFTGDPQDVRTWPRLDNLAEHAEAVALAAREKGIADPTARLMGELGMLFDVKARYDRTERMMGGALALTEASRGKDHPDLAVPLNNLAQLLQATNRLGEAEPLMRRALAIDEASYGAEHPSVGRDLNNLAQLLQATNRLEEAEPLMRRALAIGEASHGAEHPTVAIRLNNLATLMYATNRLGEAEPLMRRALAIDEASYGAEHPRVATHLNNLATLLQATNRLGEAEPLIRRALAIDEASYGAEHPLVAIRLNNLAQLLQATNRLGEAEPLMRRALAIDEASYGAEHPEVAIRLNNLAGFLQATNRLGEAEPLMRRALAIDEASYGAEHPRVAIDLNNLAVVIEELYGPVDAEPMYRRALAIDEASYGPDHPSVAIRLNNLADTLQATNRLGEAEPLMRRMVVIFLKFQHATGHPHPHRETVLANHARLLRALGGDEASIAAEQQAMHREAGLA